MNPINLNLVEIKGLAKYEYSRCNSMNFLAHLYLSGDDEQLRLGNFIGDFVKGKLLTSYSGKLALGIKIHREIDKFTDSHPIVLESKKRLRPKYRHYSPVIVDMFYDHFLASLWANYHKEDLLSYTEKFYKYAEVNKALIPPAANKMLIYMSRDNWLYNYQFLEGLNKALTGMSHRTPFISKMNESVDDLAEDYDLYKAEFETFFPILSNHISKLISK